MGERRRRGGRKKTDDEEDEKMRVELGEMLKLSQEKVTERKGKRGIKEYGSTGGEGETIERLEEKKKRIGKAIQKEKENKMKGNRMAKTMRKSLTIPAFNWKPKLAFKRRINE